HFIAYKSIQQIESYFVLIELKELSYAGAGLQDNWCVSDFGIATASTIRCQVKEVSKAILHVFSAITKATLPIMGPVTLLRSLVSKLKSVVSLQLGIPVSSFRLSTGSSLHLHDCNLLSDYAVGHRILCTQPPYNDKNPFFFLIY
uniref:Ubiquitin-like domain-containing protein n=1 Tax=Sinocyclocheilus anshuiensis TaxID=1608454 RepID=A0A671K7I0_9TELE